MDYKPAILDALETMRQKELAEKQPFKARAYSKVIKQIEALGLITSMDDLADVTGVGVKIKAKLEEIFKTGVLASAVRAREALDIDAFQMLQQIYGVGPSKARSLIAADITSVDELRTAVAEDPGLLTSAQLVGLEYYEDLLERISRAEMAKHEKLLMTTLASTAPSLEGMIVGSYRRGAPNSGDIDMLITAPAGMSEKDQQAAFSAFVSALEAKRPATGYIKAILARGPKKCMAVSAIRRGKGRRLDLLLTPRAEYPFAVLYFTGSDKFNIAFRTVALERGYTLNEHALTPIREGVPAVPELKDEAAIFKFLGLRYVEPGERTGAAAVVALA